MKEKTFYLEYTPPYRWEEILDFLAGRAIPAVEVVKDGVYLRTVSIDLDGMVVRGWLSVSNVSEKNALKLVLCEELLSAKDKIITRINHLFDLKSNPKVIFETICSLNNIRENLALKGARLPGCFDAFEMSVRAVLGQQITVKAATTITGRLANTFGDAIETPIPELSMTFPSPGKIFALGTPIEDHLCPLGIIARRARTIYELAKSIELGLIDFSTSANSHIEMQKLLEIPGIGNWTAQYLAMRAMGYADAFLETDAGIKRAFPSLKPKEILALAEQWKPYRSYAAINIWYSL